MAYIEIPEPNTDQAIDDLLPLLRSSDLLVILAAGISVVFI